MKRVRNLLLMTLLCACIIFISVTEASACTMVYIGKDVSASGNTMFGRSEETGLNHNKIFFVHKAGDHKAGETYVDAYGFSYIYKTDSYRYTAVKDDPKEEEEIVDNASKNITSYEEAGVNEYGVAVSATESIHSTKKIIGEKGSDPTVDSGICEISYATLLLGQSKSAREAVKLMAETVEKVGAGETNAFIVGDQKETWYMEVLSGHQYVAYLLPDDVVLVNPNVVLFNEVNTQDTQNYIVSRDLIKVAKDAGTFVGDADKGIINIQMSYSTVADGPTDKTSEYGFKNSSRYRMAMGQNYLNPSLGVTPDDKSYVVTFKPNRKISLEELLTEFFCLHGKGTYYDSFADPKFEGISSPAQAETHIFEIRQNVPVAVSVVEWLAMCEDTYSVFVPYYPALLSDTLAAYQVEGTKYTEGSAYWTFNRTATLGINDRYGVGPKIKAAYTSLQKKFMESFHAQDEYAISLCSSDVSAASDYGTKLGKDYAQTALNKARTLYNLYDDNGVSIAVGKEFNSEDGADLGAAFIDEYNRTQVPLRAVANLLSLDVSWDKDTQTATCTDGSTTVKFVQGNADYRVNGKNKTMDTTVVNVDDHVYVPVYYLAEAFGFNVIWNSSAKTINILYCANANNGMK